MIDVNKVNKSFFSIPAPDVKKRWEQEYKDITVHTQRKSPGELLTKRRPTESKETYEYRVANFEHLTNNIFNRAVERLQELLTESNASVSVSENLTQYIEELKIDNLKFWQWMNSKVIRRMIDDPNGLIVWWPDGEGITDASSSVEVKPLLILSKKIRHWRKDFVSWKSEEINKITLQNGTTVDGEVYYLVDETYYYKYVQIQAGGISKYQLQPYYKHGLGKMPLITLGGDQITDEKTDELVYTSFFYGAVPPANEAIKNYSDHQASVITSAHPIREMESTTCTHQGCESGKIREAGKGMNQWKTCPSCKGTGLARPLSPYGVLLRPKNKSINGDEAVRTDAIKYHVLPPANLEYQEKHWRNFLADAEKALNLLRVESAQSGLAKEIDREGTKAMIDKIGFHFYNHIVKQSLEFISKLRFINQNASVTLVLPKSFKPKTEADLAEEVTMLKEKGAPSFLIQMATHHLIKERYSSDKVALKMAEYLLAYDPLFPYTEDEKGMMLANGAVERDQYSFSVLSPSILFKVQMEMGKPAFLNATMDAIHLKVNADFQKQKPVQATLYDDNGNPNE